MESAAWVGVEDERFWAMTPVEFSRVAKAFSDKEKRRDEAEDRRAAWICATLINTAGKTFKRHVKPDDLLGKKGEPLTKSKWEEIKKRNHW